jgi:hypothetical protein
VSWTRRLAHRPTPRPRKAAATRVGRHIMARVFLIVCAAFLAGLVVGMVYLGAFPPSPHVQTVEKVLPNDHFQTN